MQEEKYMNLFRKYLLLFQLFLLVDFYVLSAQNVVNLYCKSNEIYYYNKGDYNKTIQYLFHHIESFKKNNDSVNLYRTWCKISVVYSIQKREFHRAVAFNNALNYEASRDLNYYHLAMAYCKSDTFYTDIKKHLCSIAEGDDMFLGRTKIYMLLLIESRRYIINDKINLPESFKKIKNKIESNNAKWVGSAFYNYQLGVYYYYSGKFKESLYYIIKARSIYEQLACYSNEWINCFNFLFVNNFNLEKTDLQKKYFNDMNRMFRNGNIKGDNMFYYYKIKGMYYYVIGNFNESINAFLEAYKHSNPNTYERDLAVYRLIDSYFILGNFTNVIEWHKRYSGRKTNLYYTMIASSYLKKGDKKTADSCINIIIENYKHKIEDIKLSYSRLSRYYADAHDLKNAIYYLEEDIAYHISVSGPFNQQVTNDYSRLAYMYWTMKGEVQKALEYYHKEIYILTRAEYVNNVFDIPNLDKSINDESLARALRNSAEAFGVLAKDKKTANERLKYQKASLGFYELALKVVSRRKNNLLREDQKLIYTDLIKHYFPYIIQKSIDLYTLTHDEIYLRKAFEYTEKSKASLLLTMVRGAGARKLVYLPVALQKKEDQINSKTYYYSQLLSNENNKANPNVKLIDDYNTELDQLQQQEDSLKGVLKAHHPDYYNISYNSEVITIDSLQKQMTPDQVIIQYSLSPNRLVCFLITKNSYKMVSDTLVMGQLFSDIVQYRKYMTGFDYSDTRDNKILAFESVSNRLYNRLLQPFEKYFANKELIVLPDGELNLIPFESLIFRKLDRRLDVNYKNLNYLIKKLPIGYNYSATLFAYTRRNDQKKRHASKLLAIAPMDLNYSFSQIDKKNIEEAKRDSNIITPIPGSIDEVKCANQIFGGTLLLKNKATESAFKELAGNFDILHIASHGFVNNEYPLLSKLLFISDKDSVNDGLLNAYEIYNLRLNSPLVVLSACNTGYGKLYKGEGIISLARGFFLAGSQNVIMTLWSVADKTSVRLMKNFYSQLAEGKKVGDALQKSKIQYLENSDEITSHPYFWAGYVTVGNTEMCFEKPMGNKYYWYFSGICSAMVIIVIVAVVRVKARSQTETR